MPQLQQNKTNRGILGFRLFAVLPRFVRTYWAAAATCFVGALLFVLWWYWPNVLMAKPAVSSHIDRLQAAGQFGDQYGALSCLFTAVTLLAVLFGVVFQYRQLRHTETELFAERNARERTESDRQLSQVLSVITADVGHLTYNQQIGLAAYRQIAADVLRLVASGVAMRNEECDELSEFDAFRLTLVYRLEHARICHCVAYLSRLIPKDLGAARWVGLSLGEDVVSVALLWALRKEEKPAAELEALYDLWWLSGAADAYPAVRTALGLLYHRRRPTTAPSGAEVEAFRRAVSTGGEP